MCVDISMGDAAHVMSKEGICVVSFRADPHWMCPVCGLAGGSQIVADDGFGGKQSVTWGGLCDHVILDKGDQRILASFPVTVGNEMLDLEHAAESETQLCESCEAADEGPTPATCRMVIEDCDEVYLCDGCRVALAELSNKSDPAFDFEVFDL